MHVLQHIRRERSLTAEQMALILGFSRTRYYELLKGEWKPSLPLIDRISKKLHVHWGELVEHDGHFKWVEVND